MLKPDSSITPGAYQVVDPDVPLYAGLYVVVGPSGAGKSLLSLALASQLTVPVQFMYVNESHGAPLDLMWLINQLSPTVGFWGRLAVLVAEKGAGAGAEGTSALGDRGVFGFGKAASLAFTERIVLIDSATQWLWQAEAISITQRRGSGDIAYGKGAAKPGGYTGEVQSFLSMVDQCAVRLGKTLIFTVNSEQYRLGGQWTDLYGVFKGIVTGVLVPHPVPGGVSTMQVTDRSERSERTIRLASADIRAAAAMLDQKLVEFGGPPKGTTGASSPTWRS